MWLPGETQVHLRVASLYMQGCDARALAAPSSREEPAAEREYGHEKVAVLAQLCCHPGM